MKKYLWFVFVCFSSFLSAQNTINQYRYVIVPAQFGFSSEKDQYHLNTLTKMLLEKYGFKAYLDTEELPAEIRDSNCDKLFAEVKSSGSFIMTKMQVTLKDCSHVVVYESAVGKSKEKKYRDAYTEALSKAFDSFEALHYQYQPLEIKPKKEVLNPQTTIMNASFEDTDLLQAQPIPNGYQLVDATSKVVIKALKTSNPQMFTAIKGTITGVLISKDNQWFFEYYQQDQLVSEKIDVKF
ncbi:hypothetical protein [Flavobacterium sp.]|uniref:hypothetical protein n=1 Tax=Flavobacterium sp. TaxID=239 RepID=UPI002614596B|nr:hypothetical protein [Flavobacterium sp.]